jgi:hypothetical protein
MTPDAFRRLALALPDTVEGAHHDHPDFRAHGRVFASLHPDGEQAMVKVPLPVQQALVRAHAGSCVPANGAWGRAGCTMLRLAAFAPDAVRDALREAWELAGASAAKPPTKGGAKRAAKPAGKPTAKSAGRRTVTGATKARARAAGRSPRRGERG